MVFTKGCQFLLVSLGEGSGGRCGVVSVENEGKAFKRGRGWEGWGMGWGEAKKQRQLNAQAFLINYRLSEVIEEPLPSKARTLVKNGRFS